MGKMENSPVRLNLGCGEKPLPRDDGWINIDLREPKSLNGDVFFYHDLREPLPFDDETADEIYAKHLIEHLTLKQWERVLPDWVRVLKHGGRMVIECPDILKCCEAFVHDLLGCRWGWWHHTIYGTEEHGGPHRQGFTKPRLYDELTEAGMAVTRLRNWHDDVHPGQGYNIRCEAVRP